MNKIALISGASGQDASYLAEHLLLDGYEVHGLARSRSKEDCKFVPDKVIWHKGDICDFFFLEFLFCNIKPTRIYNLAAQSEVRLSCDLPHLTTTVNSIGTLNMLEAFHKNCPGARFYQAGSSEMFGLSIDFDGMQREETPMNPITPYGISKLYAHKMCHYYRNQLELFVSNGILFNHESPRRTERFLTTKVVKAAVAIKLGKMNELKVGNMDVSRDWGHSKDYTKSMVLMLEQECSSDFVISSMKSYTVRYLIQYVFSVLDLDYEKYIIQDDSLVRKIDQKMVCGDSSKARKVLKWDTEYTFESMLNEMVSFWLNEFRK